MSRCKSHSYILVLVVILSYVFIPIITINAQSDETNIVFEEVAHLSTGGDTFQTEIVDDIAYIIDMNTGLKIFDVSNPSNPILIDSHFDGGVPHHFVIKDELLYLADHADGLEIFNISDPSDIDKIGEISDSGDGETDGVFVTNNIAYTAEWHDSTWSWKMVLINVTDPTDPQRISEYTDADDEFVRFIVQGDICYTACLHSGFKILNVSDPHSITQISSYTEGEYSWNFQILDDVAYICGEELLFLNISDINNPSLVLNFSPGNPVFTTHVEENIAYVGISQTGLQVLNIDTNGAPVEIGLYEANNIVHVTKSGGYIYLSMHDDDLLILKSDSNGKISAYPVFVLIISIFIPTIVLIMYISRRKIKRKIKG